MTDVQLGLLLLWMATIALLLSDENQKLNRALLFMLVVVAFSGLFFVGDNVPIDQTP